MFTLGKAKKVPKKVVAVGTGQPQRLGSNP